MDHLVQVGATVTEIPLIILLIISHHALTETLSLGSGPL